MRNKYNVFDVLKVNLKTIDLAVTLKKQQEKTQSFEKLNLKGNPDPNYIPCDKDALLEYLSAKYLHLKPKDGIPLLKQAYRKQFKIEDEYKKCKQCGRLFRFTKKTKEFCCNRCRQRYYRHHKRGVK